MKFFNRKPVEYWIEHEQELRKHIKNNLKILLVLIPLCVFLWHYQILLFVMMMSAPLYILFELMVDWLSLQEVKMRLRRQNKKQPNSTWD